MKTTGVVRRIDDLGRIVIPKEIRKTLHIRDGESMEIFVDNDYITLKKYSSFDEFVNIAKILVDSIYKEIKKTVFITDMNKVVSYNSVDRKKYVDYKISSYLEKIINERKSVNLSNFNGALVEDIKSDPYCLIYPIIANGDASGAVILTSSNDDINQNEEQLIKFVSEFLGKNIEE